MSEGFLEYANDIIKAFEEMGVDARGTYTACGLAFYKMHMGLGLTKQDWLDTTRTMGEMMFKEKKDDR